MDLESLDGAGGLSLEQYLGMYRCLGEERRFRVLNRLVEEEEMSHEALEGEFGAEADEVLSRLQNAHLVERWEYTEEGETGVTERFKPTVFGRVALTDGIPELLRDEREIEAMYRSETESTDS